MNELKNGLEAISLRDYFAGQALTGWLASPDLLGLPEQCAQECYKYADAMLSQREESKP